MRDAAVSFSHCGGERAGLYRRDDLMALGRRGNDQRLSEYMDDKG